MSVLRIFPRTLIVGASLAGGCDSASKAQVTKARVEDWACYFRVYHTDHDVPAASMAKVLFGARARIQMSMAAKDRSPLSPATLEESLSDAWGHPLRFAYRTGDNTEVVVESAGADGRFGTPDDIASALELTPVNFAKR